MTLQTDSALCHMRNVVPNQPFAIQGGFVSHSGVGGLGDSKTARENCTKALELEGSARDISWDEFLSEPFKWWDNRSTKGKLPPGKFTGAWTAAFQPVFDHRTDNEVSTRVASVFHDGTWSKLLDEGQLSGIVAELDTVVQQGLYVDQSVFYGLLKRCIAQKDLDLGSRVHALAAKGGYESDAFLANHIICMYASHGKLEAARQVFSKVASPSRYMWSSIISANARHGQATEAKRLYQQVLSSTLKPDTHIFVAVLRACATADDLPFAREVYADILKTENRPNLFLGNCLVDMFSRCGSLVDARRVFDNMAIKDVLTWNTMIAGYAQHGLGQEALSLYGSMQQEGITPADRVTFVRLVQACAKVGALHQGKQLHTEIRERQLGADMVLGTCLVDMYAKCKSLEDAREVFDNLPLKDVVTWNAMIAGYAQNGLGQQALALYASMQEKGTSANHATFVYLLEACASVGALQEARQLHAQIQGRGLEADVVVGTSLVDMYSNCGSLSEARRVFDNLHSKNVVTWTAMIAGYSQHGLSQEALTLYASMQQDGIVPADAVTFVCLLQVCAGAKAVDQGKQLHKQIQDRGLQADLVLSNCLVNMYAKCGNLEDARQIFNSLPKKDVVTWNAMITGYSQHGLGEDAIAIYETMQQEGMTPADAVTYVSLLRACSSGPGLEKGKQIHAEIANGEFEAADLLVANALIDMYSKCGSLDDARRVFDNVSNKDVLTWTALIAGYAQHGLSEEALALFATMQQEAVTPADGVTFVSLLQSSASIRALHQGKLLHAQIVEQGLEADVVVATCLVDMYVKCGNLEDARRVFDNLPSKNVVTWTVMITGYGQHGQNQEALSLYDSMQREGITPANAVTFVCLLQACGSLAGLEKGKEIHAQISKVGLQATDSFVANALIDMYGKCGSMVDAEQVFKALAKRDIVAWNALIAGYVRQGENKHVFDLLGTMIDDNIQPDGITFLSVLTVCSHVGLVARGLKYFEAMSRDYGIAPTAEHYNCMVDLLGRAGQVDKAVEMVKTMPFQPNGVVWRCILGACQKWHNVELGRQAFEQAVMLDNNDAAAYVLMSNIYAHAQMHDSARDVQAVRLKAQAWKQPGQSWWMDTDGVVHTFVVGDKQHPEWHHINAKLKYLIVKLKKHGYLPHLDSVLRDIPDDDKEAALCGHSEKLALAYALHRTPEGTTVRVVKNLRVCEDCHMALALVSKVEKRTIVCRDASRFHVYNDGKCSCGDYW